MKDVRLSKLMGLVLLGLLTLLFRFPVTDSPTDSDNFFYATTVKSVLSDGQIFWAEHIFSFYGLYPGTTPLGGTILATSIVQITGISIHHYQLFHSIFLSLISTFGFFLLSGELTSNYKSRWISSLAFLVVPKFVFLNIWRFSLRFLLIAFLTFFFWAILRFMNEQYNRSSRKMLLLLVVFTITLPSLHRMGLLFPGFLLSFLLAFLFWNWQEKALNRERAGRQIFFVLTLLASYFFYLSYLDFSPYSPDKKLFAVYYLNEGGFFSTIINLGFYYLINTGPMISLSLVGFIFWIQEGRVPFGYMFFMSSISLATILILDLIYISYLVTFMIIVFVIPGMDFFIDNLKDYRIRFRVFFVSILILTVSFSSMNLFYRLEEKENENYSYTYNVSEASISTGLWFGENFYSEIIESNDRNRERRVVAYSDSVSQSDLTELSSGKIILSDMEISRISVVDFYWESEDHLWKWNNAANQSALESNVSIVNLAMSNFTGQASTNTLIVSNYYKSMPYYNFNVYRNEELAVYWTNNY